jgi:low affinity Fe/Cu permease
MERMRRAFNRFAERHADLFGQILLMGVAVGLGFFAGLAAGHYVAMHFGPVEGLPF